MFNFFGPKITLERDTRSIRPDIYTVVLGDIRARAEVKDGDNFRIFPQGITLEQQAAVSKAMSRLGRKGVNRAIARRVLSQTDLLIERR